VVRFGPTGDYGQTVTVDESVTLHHVEIPLIEKGKTYHYSVSTGKERSPGAKVLDKQTFSVTDRAN
jgi:hypothetical protein